MGRPVVQWQLLSRNPEAAAGFYSTLFGWQVNTDNAMGYRQIDTCSHTGIPGGIWPSPPEGHAFFQLFIEVEDCDVTVQTAVSLGAQVIVPPQRLPDGERMAILCDPEGVPFGLVQPVVKEEV